ncbi:MAG: hypothetical protein K2K82_06645 [Muribaculaceae bacterium]|nr:hypothetical protein [Muribaculaceae bacterium]
MLRKIVFELIDRTLTILERSTDNRMLLLIIAKNQPRELQPVQIRLIAQRQQILTQVIEVEAIPHPLKLHHLTLRSNYEAIENIDILIHST